MICGTELSEEDDSPKSCDFSLAVYDSSGLRYLGEYECSLNDGKGEDGAPSSFAGAESLRVRFQ